MYSGVVCCAIGRAAVEEPDTSATNNSTGCTAPSTFTKKTKLCQKIYSHGRAA